MRHLTAIALCLVLIGCARMPVPSREGKPFIHPQYGMTKQQMLNEFGPPDSVEIYKKADETRVEFDVYAGSFKSSTYQVPVCVVNNRIVGWGKTYYEDHVSQDDVRIK